MSAQKRRRQAINRRRWIIELFCRHHGHSPADPHFCSWCGADLD